MHSQALEHMATKILTAREESIAGSPKPRPGRGSQSVYLSVCLDATSKRKVTWPQSVCKGVRTYSFLCDQGEENVVFIQRLLSCRSFLLAQV